MSKHAVQLFVKHVFRRNFEFNTMHMYFWFNHSTFCGYLNKVQVTTSWIFVSLGLESLSFSKVLK